MCVRCQLWSALLTECHSFRHPLQLMYSNPRKPRMQLELQSPCMRPLKACKRPAHSSYAWLAQKSSCESQIHRIFDLLRTAPFVRVAAVNEPASLKRHFMRIQVATCKHHIAGKHTNKDAMLGVSCHHLESGNACYACHRKISCCNRSD